MPEATKKDPIITPYGNRVLVLLDKDQERTVGGVIVKSEQTTCRLATVLAVGPGEFEDGVLVRPMVEVKARVIVPRKHMGYAPFPERPDVVLMAAHNIAATVTDEPENSTVA